MSSAKIQLVKSLIQKDSIVIFSKSFCPFCRDTKRIFQDLNQNYTVIELDTRRDCREIQAVLSQMTGASTVPRVFMYGEFIGGATDIRKLYQTGDLENLLAE